ncbi:MAG: acyltransferase, partial [Devosia sp.]|nr:acyltransferase [Devosia sp.]
MTLLSHDESPFSRRDALSAAEEAIRAADHAERLQWLTWDRPPVVIASPVHVARKAKLALWAGAPFAPKAYVASDAAIFTSRLVLGENSWIAGHALVRGDIEFGANSTVNP